MELGEKLRLARQEAGLSQRQLCGDIITRNMLSQIEHGAARPSMDTLRSLAGRLGKPVSFFLEEDVVTSPNQSCMAQAREAYRADDIAGARHYLAEFREPDPVLEWEWKYLSFLTALRLAEQALGQGKSLYARQLLEEAAEIDHGIPGLERQRLLALGRIPGMDPGEIVKRLPSMDDELLLRAEAALTQGDAARADELLAAAENRETPKWNLLRGRILMRQKQYAQAAECLEKAEPQYPEQCWPLQEECYRELGNFQQAYLYACKQR